jgi:7-cyano-7-deazaguanine synthase
MMEKAVAIVSGGMDSVTLAHMLHHEGYAMTLLSFDYGQRHVKELEYAHRCAVRLAAEHRIIDLSSYGRQLRGSALTDSTVEVPDGHYAADSMKSTVVPNRNAIMLALAYGIAVAEYAEVVATGVHAGDHHIYPDCRPGFIEAFDAMQRQAVEGFGHPGLRLDAPFVDKSKTDIALIGKDLGVPFEETWSCYKGGATHCGTCGTCVERQEALRDAGVTDPTVYLSVV